MRRSWSWRVLVGLTALALGAAGCGGDDDDEAGGGQAGAPTKGKRGGHLTILYAGDVDSPDPAVSYYQYSFNIMYATQRPLYSYKPEDQAEATPDLAQGQPRVSADGREVTVKIKSGVRFSPPVDREVTSEDVKYAMERGFLKTVPSGYAGAYWKDIEGVEDFQKGRAKEVEGIQTPDARTITFRLGKPRGALVAASLVLPGTAPVPKEYAQRLDRQNPSGYGRRHVATGPYMIRNDSEGKLVGYKPGRLIELVRNPSWDPKTDYRPAYLDRITIREGTEAPVASRQILNGRSQVNGDFQVPPAILKQLSTGDRRSQLVTTPPTGRFRYVAFNTKKPPFDDINVRKAVAAGFDRNAMRLAFGGPITGDIPTHFIPPGQPGFEEAGGTEGPGVDFLAKPDGDPELAAEYFRKAGFESGRYEGKAVTMVADNAEQQKRAAQVAADQLEKLGFEVRARYVTRDTMYTKFCQVPDAQPEVCPSVGWLKDFADAETLLGPTFKGENILDTNNSNFAQLDVPRIDAAIDKAEALIEPGERERAWGEIDKLVTAEAPGVPWLWDKQPNILSSNVNGVISRSNATWDLSFTSLK